MANKTTNYNLTKPSAEDFYDVNVQNDNMDIIDAQMKVLQTGLSRANGLLITAQNEIDAVSIESNDTKETFEEHLTASNPHNITAEAIGLGNVPNVATNDQIPTYTKASTLAEIISGEKLSVAFGKIKRAIADFIEHSVDNVRHITNAERMKWNATLTNLQKLDDRVKKDEFQLIKQITLSGTKITSSSTAMSVPVPISGVDFNNYSDVMVVLNGTFSVPLTPQGDATKAITVYVGSEGNPTKVHLCTVNYDKTFSGSVGVTDQYVIVHKERNTSSTKATTSGITTEYWGFWEYDESVQVTLRAAASGTNTDYIMTFTGTVDVYAKGAVL